MSHNSFNERVNRINNRSALGMPQMALGEGGAATSRFSSPMTNTIAPTRARGNLKPMLLGAVLGMIIGALAAGLENSAMPWGVGSDYYDMIAIPVLLALVAGPVMAIAATALRQRMPSLFFFAAAYFPCSVGLALVDLPLF